MQRAEAFFIALQYAAEALDFTECHKDGRRLSAAAPQPAQSRTNDRAANIISRSRDAHGAARSDVRSSPRDPVCHQRLHRHNDRLVHPEAASATATRFGRSPRWWRPRSLSRRRHRRLFRSRLVNVLVGCTVGFGLLLVGGHSDWMIPFALAATVLISSYVIRIKTMWRQAPITAAIVIAAGISHGSQVAGIEQRVAQGGGGALRMRRGAGGELADVEGLARQAEEHVKTAGAILKSKPSGHWSCWTFPPLRRWICTARRCW